MDAPPAVKVVIAKRCVCWRGAASPLGCHTPLTPRSDVVGWIASNDKERDMEDAAENLAPAKKPLPLPVGNSDWAHVAAHNRHAKLDSEASPETIAAALDAVAREARDQIDAKRCAAEMEASGIPVLKYGVGFLGKRVALAK